MKLIVLVDFLKIRWYVDSCNKNFNKFNTDINMIFIVTKKNKKLIKLHIKNFIKNRCNICTINYLYNIFLYKIFFQFIYYSKKKQDKETDHSFIINIFDNYINEILINKYVKLSNRQFQRRKKKKKKNIKTFPLHIFRLIKIIRSLHS